MGHPAPPPKTKNYLTAAAYGAVEEYIMRYAGFTAEDEARFIKHTERGLTAIFIYTNKLISNGERLVFNPDDRLERPVILSDDIYAPVSLFTKFLGAEYKKRCGRVTLTLGENKISIKDDVKVGYLPCEQVCRALGFFVGKFSENSFFVIGKEEDVAEIAADEALCAAGPYALFGDYDTSKFTDEDYEAVAKNYHDKLVGNEEINNMDNPYVRAKVEAIEKKCEQALKTLDRSGDPPILWGEKLLRDTEDGAAQYYRVRDLTKGYATYGSKFYKDKDVFDAIIYSLEWMYRHAYGEDMIEGHGWRDPKLPNWWYMYIGAPEVLTEVLLILYKEISIEDRRRYLKCFVWIASWMCLGPQSKSSRLKICTEYGVLLHEPSYLIKESEDYDAVIGIERKDYVNFTHTYPHNMSYGGILLSRGAYIASVLAGTPLEYNSPNFYKQFNRIKYMYEPALYEGQAFFMLSGRYTERLVESTKAAGFLQNALSMIGVFGENEDAYIKQFLKRHSKNPVFKDCIFRSAAFNDIAKFEEILADESIPYEYDYDYAYSWYTGDRAALHRNNYAFGIAMASNRHINYEAILHVNKTGWYTGDGAFHLYTSYDNAQYDGVNFIQNINIAYRFPGTTEDMQERAVRGIYKNPWKSPCSFAGSMELHNKYIVAGMDFVSEYCDEDLGFYDEVTGYSRAVHKNDLVAKKAWFCFDDEAVLLGAGITSTMNSPVNTIAAHRRIVRDDEFTQTLGTADGAISVPKAEYEERFVNPRYFNWAGHAGYVFLDKTNLLVNRYNYTTEVEQPYLELRIEHGENPTDATYAFAVIPYATNERLIEYSKNPDVEIVSNTAALQAVREKNVGVTGYVFYEAGECENISVDRGAIVFAEDKDGKFTLSVCDPTHGEAEIAVKLSGKYKLVSSDAKVAAAEIADGYEIKVNCIGAMGAPFRLVFEKN